MDILVSEVGPRDGLQSLSITMPTPAKHAWIQALATAGLKEIEVGSFVNPRLLPQLADTGEVVNYARQIDGLEVMALVPNLHGAQLAVQAGVHKVNIPVSASQAHNSANVRMTCEQGIEAVAEICRFRNSLPPMERVDVEVGIASAFGCTREGLISEDWVMEMALKLVKAGADTVGLSDSVGYANPKQVKRMFLRLQQEIGEHAGGAHLHNTRGQGLANVVAALEAGVTTFDSSQGGIGGCPYAPGATGNIVTEDLVCLLETMGLDTGIDFHALLQAREILQQALPTVELYGSSPIAGLPKGFQYANPLRTLNSSSPQAFRQPTSRVQP